MKDEGDIDFNEYASLMNEIDIFFISINFSWSFVSLVFIILLTNKILSFTLIFKKFRLS